MLIDLKEMEIKKLSEIYDVESRESFVSLYMNMEKTNEILDLIDVDFDEADGYLISMAEEAVQKDEKKTV